MILVVMWHMLVMMGLSGNHSVLGSVINTFNMPLFFFISGFFAYKSPEKCGIIQVGRTYKRKIQALVIGTFVFYSICLLCNNHSPINYFLEHGINGYWFTLVLFQMISTYMAIAVIEHYVKKRIMDVILVMLALLTFLVYVRGFKIDFYIWRILDWYDLLCYFNFFSVGILARKHYSLFHNLICNNVFRTSIILIYLLSLFLVVGYGELVEALCGPVYRIFQMLIVKYSGVLVVFVFFFSKTDYFESDGRPGRWMRFVGRRSLDIYFIHYLMLPNLHFLTPYLEGPKQTLLLLFVALFVAILNIACCGIISEVIRSSSFLSEWLFGEKNGEKKASANMPAILP